MCSACKDEMQCRWLPWLVWLLGWTLAVEGSSSESSAILDADTSLDCSKLGQLSYVRKLKTLALNTVKGTPIDPGSVKVPSICLLTRTNWLCVLQFNLTNCFFEINGLQEIILRYKEFESNPDELSRITEPHSRFERERE